MRGFHDASGAEALLHERGDFIEQRVGLGAAATVVDQENRAALTTLAGVCFGAAHREYLGLRFAGVKKRCRPSGVLDTGGERALYRS